MTEQDAENKAAEWYDLHKGKVVLVNRIDGYYGDTDDQVELVLDPPAKVRIEDTPADCYATRWMDDWLDPLYDVTLVEPHPQLADIRSLWVYGTSYNPKTGEEQAGDIVGVVE